MMRRAGGLGWMCAVAMLLASAPAHAQTTEGSDATAATSPAQDLAAIREMLLYARYSAAEPAITALLARMDLTATERNAGLESRAMVLIARRRAAEARAVLAELYSRDPDHRITDPDAGPDVRNEFDRARAAHPTPVAVTIEDSTEDTLGERVSPTVQVEITGGGDAVLELRLWYRNGAEGAFQQSIMNLDPATRTARARIPLADGRDEYTAQYYVDAIAPSGAALQRLGSPEAPITVVVPAAPEIPVASVGDGVFATTGPADQPRSGDVTQQWWFWTLLGVVVVGTGVGIGFGVNAATTPSGPMPGTLGEGRL
jgi:hypothetical protein